MWDEDRRSQLTLIGPMHWAGEAPSECVIQESDSAAESRQVQNMGYYVSEDATDVN